MGMDQHGYDDDEKEAAKRYNEFECPDCDANNPVDDGFTDGSEVRCYYCGMAYQVQVTEAGKLKYKAV
ncbi:MAG: hypothetical protein P1V51_06090 [Deltaproteobacteria bacterium]|nr:hypothetical protein [Deltaproteobacteria bacterium]